MLRNIRLGGEPLDLDVTFGSGQIFGWRKMHGCWAGNIRGWPVTLKKEGDLLTVRSDSGLSLEEVAKFLHLDEDHLWLAERLRDEPRALELLTSFKGMRILRQDPWSCLISYIVSSSLNISVTEKALTMISQLGKEKTLNGHRFWAIPDPEVLLNSPRPRKDFLGKKWYHIVLAAERAIDGRLDFEDLLRATYERAWHDMVINQGTKIMGVGPKVADCVLLFSLDKMESFPMDRWVLRGLVQYFPDLIPEEIVGAVSSGMKSSLSVREYEKVSATVRARFGCSGGLLQECLFMRMRKLGWQKPRASA